MDDSLQNNRKFYLPAVAYINASQLMINSYNKEKLFSDDNPLSTIQMMPLYYLFRMAGELCLKAVLTLHDVSMKEIQGKKQGHDLNRLVDLYESNISEMDSYFKSMFLALNKGEFRYTDYTGAVYLEVVDYNKYLMFIRDMTQKNQSQYLEKLKEREIKEAVVK